MAPPAGNAGPGWGMGSAQAGSRAGLSMMGGGEHMTAGGSVRMQPAARGLVVALYGHVTTEEGCLALAPGDLILMESVVSMRVWQRKAERGKGISACASERRFSCQRMICVYVGERM